MRLVARDRVGQALRLAAPRGRLPADHRLPLVLAAGLAVWTVAIMLVPFLRFTLDWPRVRVPLETAGAVVSALTATMGLLKYSLGGHRSWLFISLAFLVAAVNQFVFGVVIPPEETAAGTAGYVWIVGRLEMAGLLLLGVWAPASLLPEPRSFRAYLPRAALALGVLASLQALVFASRDTLPPLVAAVPPRGSVTGSIPGLTTADIALGVLGSVLFFVAAAGYLRTEVGEGRTRSWLAIALILGGFSHLHYMLVPTVFTDEVSTGDVLRLALAAVLLAGLLQDVYLTYAREIRRSRELATEHERQRRRLHEMEELDRSKADLLRVLSHELLHPVAAIRSMILALRKGGAAGAAAPRLIEGIVRQSGQLRELAERAPDLVELRSIAFEPDREAWRVEEILRSVDRTFPDLADRLEIVVAPEAAAETVDVDVSRLMQVFHNLLSNAVRFSPRGSPILLRAAVRGGSVAFSVVDAGRGIRPEDEVRLFEPFVRLDDAGDAAGSGLGLYIARQIVEAHGGTIALDRDREGGASFTFTLPRTGGAR